MVMKQNMMVKNLTQSIRRSFGRYLAIVLIIALGCAIFTGLRMTKIDMVETGQVFTDEQNAFDLRLLSSYGWTDDQVEQVQNLSGLVDVEASVYQDVLVRVGDKEEDEVFRFYSLPDLVNKVDLRGGRMPQNPNECLADGFNFDDTILGQTVTVSEANNEDTLDAMVSRTYTVVGYVASPLFMDPNRGSTTVGSGVLESYFYIPAGGFDLDYYTEINVTIPGDYRVYTDIYNDALDHMTQVMEPQVQAIADGWFRDLVDEAEAEYADGYQQYLDGVAELEQGKLDAEKELADAYRQLKDAQNEINANEKKLNDGAAQIADAKKELSNAEKELKDGKKELDKAKKDTYAQLNDAQAELDANAALVADGRAQAQDGLQQIDDGLVQVNDGIAQLEEALPQLEDGIHQLETAVNTFGPLLQTVRKLMHQLSTHPQTPEEFLQWMEDGADLIPELMEVLTLLMTSDLPMDGLTEMLPDMGSWETPKDCQEMMAQLDAAITEMETMMAEYAAQLPELKAMYEEYSTQLEELYVLREELTAQREDVVAALAELEDAQAQIDAGYAQLADGRAQADKEFAKAEAEIADGEKQINSAKSTLSREEAKLADGRRQLNDGKAELAQGWIDYEEGKATAEAEIADAEAKLADAEAELADARQTIDDLEAPKTYVLDRNTNVGYASLDSNSDILEGVSRVFPVFFLLIASLVCITTMTRMVAEERTQIGTLKALGYSNMAIISKYLVYAGSGAIVGCVVGSTLGCIIFPKLIWFAYGTMLYIEPEVQLCFDWKLCAIVTSAYTAVVLGVTWYCCQNTLKEVPAELIRPKAPTTGKKIILEYFPFWKRISFLNKVALRNIFRYRQRLLMMLIGIGGCTALLLTGFGLQDSIADIVKFQYEDINQYDMEVYFDGGQSTEAQQAFRDAADGAVESVLFYHQQSVEVDFRDQVREVTLIAADESVSDFIHFQKGGVTQPLPGVDEALLSIGVAEAMGVCTGDTITVRNADMESLTLRVCGIYENYVQNFAVIHPDTIASQWGREAEQQMAFLMAVDGVDLHETSAMLTDLDGVMNVSISQDTAGMMVSMMDALGSMVLLVIFCAGLLAVVVLYNLTNININERIREIATIKVLGFRAGETASYVFKENFVLSVVGSLAGLWMGYGLLSFIISQVRIDTIWFSTRITPLSMVISVGMTMAATLIVQMIFTAKLEKINMAEALKSVE